MTSIRPTDPTAVDARAAAAVSEQRVLEAAGVFARAGTALRHCLDEVEAADDAAWTAYSEASRDAIAHLQAELVLAGARLNAERAADHDEVRDAATAASHLARQRLETLRVRAHLGVMDVESVAERAVDDLEQIARVLKDRSRRVQHSTTQTLEGARQAAGDAIHGARRALMVVAAAARPDDITFERERRPR